MNPPYRLITIPPSHYCEKARWALDYLGVPYREEGHPPLLHRWAVKMAGGGYTTPVLVTSDKVLADSTDILQYLDTTYVEGWRPYPQDSQHRVEAEEMEELFDTRLGPHTRRIAYYHLLQHNDLFLESVLPGVGSGERLVFRVLMPAIRSLMRRAMRINPESTDRSLERVRTIFATVDELLGGGRTFLVGDNFSAAPRWNGFRRRCWPRSKSFGPRRPVCSRCASSGTIGELSRDRPRTAASPPRSP
jgi:glutathione S-transferase